MTEKVRPLEKIKEVIAKAVPVDEKKEEARFDPNAPTWIKYVAMLTGVLAALTGFLTVRSTMLTNQAIYESNQAILAQTQSSDAWSEYQADSIKARVVEMQLLSSSTLSAPDKATLTKDDADLREQRQPKNKQLALDMANQRDAHLKNGTKNLGEKDLLGFAAMAVQLSIALASVAAMVHKRIAFDAALAIGVIGIGITAYALIMNHILAG